MTAHTLNDLLELVKVSIEKAHGSPIADLPLRDSEGNPVSVDIKISSSQIKGYTEVRLLTHHEHVD
jgi:hypothetical protein